MVGGEKKIGGTISADSMEDAVRRIAKRDHLKILNKQSVLRSCDNALIPQAEWLFNGKKASIYVWAPPEYFVV